MNVRTLLGFVLELIGVLLVAAWLGFVFGWAWGLLPVGVYAIFLGMTVGERRT